MKLSKTKIKLSNQDSFLFFLGGVAAAVLLWGGGVKFHQYGVFANFANLVERDKDVLAAFKYIPKALTAWQNQPADLRRMKVKHNIHNMPKPLAINHVDNFFTAKVQKRTFQSPNSFGVSYARPLRKITFFVKDFEFS